MSGRRREMPTLLPFEVIAERDDAEIGRCRILAFYRADAEYDGWRQMAMNRVYDLFDESITLRVERADG